MHRYYHHYYGNDLTDALADVTDEYAMDEIVTLVKANTNLLNKLDASNRTPLFHVMNMCLTDYRQYNPESARGS